MAFANTLYPKAAPNFCYWYFYKWIKSSGTLVCSIKNVDTFFRQCAYHSIVPGRFKGIIDFTKNKSWQVEANSVYKIYVPIKKGLFNNGRYADDNTRYYCWEHFVFIRTLDKSGTISIRDDAETISISTSNNSNAIRQCAYPAAAGGDYMYKLSYKEDSWDFPFTMSSKPVGWHCGIGGYGLAAVLFKSSDYFLDDGIFKLDTINSCYEIRGRYSFLPRRGSYTGIYDTIVSQKACMEAGESTDETKRTGIAFRTNLFADSYPSSYTNTSSPSLKHLFKASTTFNFPFIAFGWADPYYEYF